MEHLKSSFKKTFMVATGIYIKQNEVSLWVMLDEIPKLHPQDEPPPLSQHL